MTPHKRKKRVLVTAALPYSNGRLHVGHIAGAYLPADIFVRYLRMRGTEVRFVSGSDDYGVAIMMSADKEGKTPADLAAWYGDRQAEDFKGLDIEFDVYGSTSRTKFHQGTSSEFFLSLHERGYFQKESSRQFFDESKGVFLPDRYVKGACGFCGTPDQNGDQCENCGKMLDVDTLKNAVSAMSGTPASVKDTVHWFIDLSRFETEVAAWLETAVVRDHTRNFVSGLLGTGLVKRSMTRDISWGIPVPLEEPDAEGKVLYVWFDAPIGYVSNTKQLCESKDGDPERYTDWWKKDDCELFHFIGEDNSVFHCIIWIAMLQAEGSFTLPTGVLANQFLNIQFPGQGEEKMSKSRGTALWIGDFVAAGGDSDGLRYYLTSIAPEKARSVYRPDEFAHRYNTELANIVGNFVHRVLSFTRKYVGDSVPEIDPAKVTERDREFEASRLVAFDEITTLMEEFSFRGALERIMAFARECNRYIDDKAPWVSRKTDMPMTTVTLVYAIQGIKLLSVVFAPVLPRTAVRMQRMLGVAAKPGWEEAVVPVLAGTRLEEPEILFRKLEDDDVESK